jgi:antitoxin VapB
LLISRKAKAVALSIKNPETERLAREIARETGESLTQAIQRDLKERRERLSRQGQRRIMAEELEDILRRVDALPTLDTRSEGEILGYDSQGFPIRISTPLPDRP